MILHLKVQAAQSLLYQLACLENDEEVPSDKPTKWKSFMLNHSHAESKWYTPRYNNW